MGMGMGMAMEDLKGYARFKGILDNLIAGAFISGIAAAAVWWFGPNYITVLDALGWDIAAGATFVVMMALLLTIDYVLAINLSFNILRSPYFLLLLPFKFVKLIDEKYEEVRVNLAEHTLPGLVVGGAIWALIVWVLFHQLVPVPDQCRSTRPCILIAGLQGDDFSASRTEDLRKALSAAFKRAGIESKADVVVIPRTLFRVVSNDPGTVHWESQVWMDRLKGNVLLYGASPRGRDMTLTVYTQRSDGGETLAGLALPSHLDETHASALALVVSEFARPDGDAAYDAGVLWPLVRQAAPFIAKLPAVMSDKTKETVINTFADAARQAGDAGNDAAMELAISAYRTMLSRKFGSPVETRLSLAAALNALGSREDGKDKFTLAQKYYDDAIQESKRGVERLDDAVTVYREVLKSIDRAHEPQRWAAAQVDLANALADIGDRQRVFQEYTQRSVCTPSNAGLEESTATLTESASAYREALKIETPPQDWAHSQYRLGCVSQLLGRNTGDAARYAEAEAAFRLALTVYTADKTPVEWADAQFHLGAVLLQVGETEHDVVRMQAGATALRDAVKVYNARHVATDNIRTAFELLDHAQAAIVDAITAKPPAVVPAAPPAALPPQAAPAVKKQHR